MVALLKEESTITAKGQTTVPKAVRQALGVDYGGRIAFFVQFLAQDMAKHPGKSIVALPDSLLDRVNALVGNMDIDLDAEIEGDVAI